MYLVVRGECENAGVEAHYLPDRPMMEPDPSPHPPRLLEVSHVAHRLSVSEEFVRRLIRKHKIAAIRLESRWRVDPVDLQAFIDKRREASQNGNGG